ncbi:MAG: hypothetical protein ACP6IQ_09650 [Candidatus Njordarchaeia archaeon]|nr:hypothetical protein [Candidatus Korarchaeota archaeon]
MEIIRVKSVIRVAVSDDEHLILFLLSNDNKRYQLDIFPEATERIIVALEKLKRPTIKDAKYIVLTAKKILIDIFIRRNIEFKEYVKFDNVMVDILKEKGSLLGSQEAYVFIPDILTEKTLLQYDLFFNDDEKNKDKINCIIVCAGATEKTIKGARKRVQVYDISSKEKGDGYDSSLFEIMMNSMFRIKFNRVTK